MSHMDRTAMDSEDFMPQIGTLSGNPVAAVAGLATLDILKREGAYEGLFATGQQLKDELTRLLNEAEIPAQVVGHASVFDVYFTETEIIDYRSTLTADKGMLARFNALLLERGVLKGSPKFYISTAHSPGDVEQTIEVFASAIDELKG